jgi:hypothetical protein
MTLEFKGKTHVRVIDRWVDPPPITNVARNKDAFQRLGNATFVGPYDCCVQHRLTCTLSANH